MRLKELMIGGNSDLLTAEGREKERHRRILLTALSSAGAKSVNVLTLLVSVPIVLGYLGTERFGLWMTISSIVAILSFADFGIGNGLLNAISEAHGKEDEESMKAFVASAFIVLMGIALIMAVIFALAYPLIPWGRVFNVTSPAAIREAGPATAVFAGCLLLNIPLGIVQKIQIGFQEGYLNSLWQAGGNLLGLLGVLVAISLKSSLPWIVLAFAGAPVVTALSNSLIEFRIRRPWLRPHRDRVAKEAVREVLRLGMLYFVLQLAAAAAFSSDFIIIAQVLGPAAVSTYSVAMRLFSIAPMILGFFLLPLWPAYGESIARGDVPWTRKTLIKSLKLTAAATGLASLFLLLLGRPIIRAWAGPEVVPTLVLLLGLGVWTVLSTSGNAVSMFLNGCHRIGFQALTGSLMAVAAVVAKITLAKSMGLPGVVWGTTIAYAACVLLPFSFYLPRILSDVAQGTAGRN